MYVISHHLIKYIEFVDDKFTAPKNKITSLQRSKNQWVLQDSNSNEGIVIIFFIYYMIYKFVHLFELRSWNHILYFMQ